MSTGFFYGQIVRIRVTRHGKEKIRPGVVVTPNEEMTEGAPLVGVAITGTPDPPTGFEVTLPWQAQGRADWPGQAECRRLLLVRRLWRRRRRRCHRPRPARAHAENRGSHPAPTR